MEIGHKIDVLISRYGSNYCFFFNLVFFFKSLYVKFIFILMYIVECKQMKCVNLIKYRATTEYLFHILLDYMKFSLISPRSVSTSTFAHVSQHFCDSHVMLFNFKENAVTFLCSCFILYV